MDKPVAGNRHADMDDTGGGAIRRREEEEVASTQGGAVHRAHSAVGGLHPGIAGEGDAMEPEQELDESRAVEAGWRRAAPEVADAPVGEGVVDEAPADGW